MPENNLSSLITVRADSVSDALSAGGDESRLCLCDWLRTVPDPRGKTGRWHPLEFVLVLAVCAFTAAGHDRFTAVGQWIKRAGQDDLARMRAPWDPVAGRYRAPDEKTIRGVEE